jgi:hypothetical protein
MRPDHQLGLDGPQHHVANIRTSGRQPLHVGRFQGVRRSRPQQVSVLADNLVLRTLRGNRLTATGSGPQTHPAMLEPAHPHHHPKQVTTPPTQVRVREPLTKHFGACHLTPRRIEDNGTMA